MKSFLLSLLSLCFLHSMGQSIHGKVTDEQDKGLAFATIQLSNKDGKVVKLETTAEDGSFQMLYLQEGFYYLQLSYVGFATYSDSLELKGKRFDLPPIRMQRSAEQLTGVTVEAQRSMIQVEPDKTVYNVSQDATATGDDGIELLRKAPGLQVDNNDNIVLEGKTGVQVFIDGKQNYLSGDDLKAYLRTIRAEEIERIEIITQPSSKYDAAGSAGIINIVLKREKGMGTKGNVSSTFTVGDFARNSATLNFNHREKKYNVFGTYSNFVGRSTSFINLYRVQSGNIFDAKTNTTWERNNNRLRLGGDYYLSKKSTVGMVVSYALNDGSNDANSRTPIINGNTQTIDSILTAPNRVDSYVNNLVANVNYVFEDTSGHRLTFDVDYVAYDRERENLQPNIYTNSSGEPLSENTSYQETPIDIDVYSIKSDYEQNLWKGKLGFGAKFSRVETNNVFEFFDQQGTVRTLNINRSNVFDYREDISAAYLNYNTKIKKWKLQGGLRVERTVSEGVLTSQLPEQNQTVNRDYTNWFPSAGITFQANRTNALALIYSRRIQRPNYQNLNPFEYQLDELSFRRGNPFLQPQFTHNIKISNTHKYTLVTSISYSYVSDYFAQVTEALGSDRNFINTRNVADQQVWNASISYPFKLKKWWQVYMNVYGYHTFFTANNPAFNPIDATTVGGYAQSTFSLPKDIKAVVSGWYSSPSIWGGTYETKSLGALNLAVQKDWKQWSFKLSFNDVLYTIPWRGETRFGSLSIDGTGGNDSRNVRFFLRYSFGHNDVKGERRRKTGAEDEQKRIGGDN